MTERVPVSRSRRSQLRDEAATYVRELIAAGQTPPGSRLPLEVLAATIGVSVTPVREALLLLAQDGIVMQEPNRGFRVAPIRRRDVADSYFVYAKVAGELGARAALRIDWETIARLRELERQLVVIPDDEHERIETANSALHDTIYAAAASPRLSWFIEASTRFVPRRYWAAVPGWLEWNRTAHKPLIDALERGDAGRARAATEEHVLHAANLLIEQFEALSLWNDH